MATTEQGNGFRLPWASDARSATPADQQPPVGEPADTGDATTEVPTIAEATEMPDSMTTDAPALTWPDSGGRVPRPADPEPNGAPTPPAPEVEPAAATPPAIAEPAAAQAAGPPIEPVPAHARRDNPLVAVLVRAMRDAAAAAREESAARFAEAAKNRFEAIHAQSGEEAAALRKRADAEIVEIREWSKAEMARLREETDQRISDRRRRLEGEIESYAALVEHRIERIQAAIGEFERRTDAFFEQLFAEDDPARLAGLAEHLPEVPSFDIDDGDLESPFPVEILEARGAAAAEAEAYAGIEDSDVGDGELGAPASDQDTGELANVDVVRRLAALSGPAADLPEAVVSRLAVVGLVRVASIAGFKRALARTHGVRSVSVASGPSGDFVFTVAHDPDTDLRSVVPNLDGFAASVTGDADGVITINASDPESTQ